MIGLVGTWSGVSAGEVVGEVAEVGEVVVELAEVVGELAEVVGEVAEVVREVPDAGVVTSGTLASPQAIHDSKLNLVRLIFSLKRGVGLM